MDDRTRADHAALILNDPAFQQAMNAVIEEARDALERCPEGDIQGMQLLKGYLRAARTFEGRLRGYIEAGKLEALKAAQMKEHRDGIRARLRKVF